MSEITVRNHLKKYSMDNLIITMPSSTATVKEAADSLGCEETGPILIVMAGDVKIDNAKYRNFFHEKAHMLSSEEVNDLIGHPIGGVCPFGVNDNVHIYLDNSLKRFTYVYPACGSTHNAIKISIPKLEEVTSYPTWIDVTKPKEN